MRGAGAVLYVSMQMKGAIQGSSSSQLEERDFHPIFVRGRLAAGVSIEHAAEALRRRSNLGDD